MAWEAGYYIHKLETLTIKFPLGNVIVILKGDPTLKIIHKERGKLVEMNVLEGEPLSTHEDIELPLDPTICGLRTKYSICLLDSHT